MYTYNKGFSRFVKENILKYLKLQWTDYIIMELCYNFYIKDFKDIYKKDIIEVLYSFILYEILRIDSYFA